MKVAAAVAASMLCGVAFAQTDEYKAAVRQGIELHDRGEFDAALKVYEAVLADQPGDTLVTYEMALTYQAKQDYPRCVELAGQVVAKPSDGQADGFSLLASCQDDAGHVEQAVETFKQGIEKYPRDVMLNLNYGLTLVRLEQSVEARRVLGVAIEALPGFASPYRAYAMALEQQGYPAAAVLTRLRFILSEPESERSIDVAKWLVETVAAASAAAKDNQTKLAVSKDDESQAEILINTEFYFGLTATTADKLAEELSKKENKELTASDRFVTFMQMFANANANRLKQRVKRESPWPAVVEPLAMLSDKEVLVPFLYHVAALGRSEGAVKWIGENSDSMGKLADVINEYHESLRKP